MIHKSIMNIVNPSIMIGHSFIIILLILLMSSCRIFEIDDLGDYRYTSYVLNNTEKALRFYNSENLTGYIIDTVIYPQEKLILKGSRGVDKSDDVIKEFLFGNVYSDTVLLFTDDSLLKTWYGPPKSLGDSVRHFYNYDSWEVELVDNEYILEFTIYESDIEK